MEIEKIPTADLLDILFEGRNKMYGAYDLRKTYNGRLARALAFTGALCLLLIGGYVLAGKMSAKHMAAPTIADVQLQAEPVAKEKPVELPQPAPRIKVQQMATLTNFVPKIVKDIEVKPEEAPHSNDDLEHVKIGLVNATGPADDEAIAPPAGVKDGTGVVDQPKKIDSSDYVFMKVEIESSYAAGTEGWKRFLLKNFRTPEEAIANEINGTVIVNFIVDKEGNVSNVEAVSGPELLRSEAVRVIKKSGKWTPAQQNGRFVNSYKKQPITIQTVSE